MKNATTTMETKICRICGEEKSINDFSKTTSTKMTTIHAASVA